MQRVGGRGDRSTRGHTGAPYFRDRPDNRVYDLKPENRAMCKYIPAGMYLHTTRTRTRTRTRTQCFISRLSQKGFYWFG